MAVACEDGTRLKVAIATPRLPGSPPHPEDRQRQWERSWEIGGGYEQEGRHICICQRQ